MKIASLVLCVVVLAGCAPILGNMPGFTHSAALMLGFEQSKVIQDAEHVLGAPIKVDSISEGEDAVNVRYYAYTEKYYIVLVFYKGYFSQLLVEKTNPDDLPYYGQVSNELKGYVITKRGAEVEIKLFGSPGSQLSPELLTLTSIDIAWMKFRDNEYEQAKKIAVMINTQYPNNTRALNLLGNIDLRKHKLESAINRFKEALQIIEKGNGNERKDPILNNLGMTYLKDKQFNNAHKIFEESISVASTANDYNCAGRIGNMLTLLSVDQEIEARKTVEPCVDSKRGVRRSLKALDNLYDYFVMSDESLKKKAISVLEQ